MAERLTKEYYYTWDENGTKKLSYIQKLQNKLGKLEDILERYNIESVENLDSILEKYFSDTWITVTPKITKNWELICDIMASDELNRNFELGVTRDRDTWKKACELACDAMTKLGGDDCCGCRLNKEMCKICENKKGLIDYFYQQAKKEGNNENNIHRN